jgi:hypothetical protein
MLSMFKLTEVIKGEVSCRNVTCPSIFQGEMLLTANVPFLAILSMDTTNQG